MPGVSCVAIWPRQLAMGLAIPAVAVAAVGALAQVATQAGRCRRPGGVGALAQFRPQASWQVGAMAKVMRFINFETRARAQVTRRMGAPAEAAARKCAEHSQTKGAAQAPFGADPSGANANLQPRPTRPRGLSNSKQAAEAPQPKPNSRRQLGRELGPTGGPVRKNRVKLMAGHGGARPLAALTGGHVSLAPPESATLRHSGASREGGERARKNTAPTRRPAG